MIILKKIINVTTHSPPNRPPIEVDRVHVAAEVHVEIEVHVAAEVHVEIEVDRVHLAAEVHVGGEDVKIGGVI